MADAGSPVVASPGGPQPVPAGPIAPPPNFATTSAAAAGPAFADASQTAGNQKAALLAAIAQAGSAGQAQFQAFQKQNAQDRQAALQAATQREAVVQNMPPALVKQLSGMTGSEFDLNKTLLGDTSQTFAQGQGLLSQAGSNYMNELQASIPVVQSETQAKIAALQEAAYQKDTTAATQAATAQARAGAVGAGGAITPAGLEKRVGGVQTLADQLQTGEKAFEQQNPGPYKPNALQDAYYASIDKFNKWPAGTAASLVNQGTTKAGVAKARLTTADINALAASNRNALNSLDAGSQGRGLAAIDAAVKAGSDYATIFAQMTHAKPTPYTAEQASALIAQYQKGTKGNQAIGGQ